MQRDPLTRCAILAAPARCAAFYASVLLWLAARATLAGAAPQTNAQPLQEVGLQVILKDGRDIVLLAALEEGDDFASLAARFTGDAAQASALRAANPRLALAADETLTVPWPLMREEYRYLALRALFPKDRFVRGAWEHHAHQAAVVSYGEGLWQAAEWFTGSGDNWPVLAKLSGRDTPDLPPDGKVRIPAALLLKRFQPVTASADGLLRYGEDDRGAYAEYSLRKGEALYSSVVVRFTGLLDPDDVVGASKTIAAASGIADVRSISAGRSIRIPLDLVAPPYLPDNHPRRVVWQLEGAERATVRAPRPPASLEGVHVLIDPGHGGADRGAIGKNVWESDYVRDVACRLVRLLGQEPGATAHLLVGDDRDGCPVRDREQLTPLAREFVATTPPHALTAGPAIDVGVNLRWYLANSLFRRLTVQSGVPPEKVVFLSLHADSLHPDVRGGMVYVPDEALRRGRQSVAGAAYHRYREYRQQPAVSQTRAERLRDEVVSRRLAEAILAGYRREGLPVHEDQPIRDTILRGKRRTRGWVPAVLRGTLVPAKVLVETLNIMNRDDARTLADPQGREKLARAILAGLNGYFSGDVQRAGDPGRSATR